MKSLFQTVALWTALAGLSWVLVTGTRLDLLQILTASGLLVLPALCVILTTLAAPSQNRPWFSRLGFWVVTAAAWLTVALFAQGRWETIVSDERQNFIFGFGLALIAAVWLGVKKRTFPKWPTLRDVAASVVVLGIAGSIFVWRYDAKTRALAAQAEARWTEIGLPMAEFEKTLIPSHESAGSEVVRQMLREIVRTRFYKEGTAAADREPPIEYSEGDEVRMSPAYTWAGFNGGPSDDFEYPKDMIARLGGSVASIAPIAPALDEAYRRILATEPAVWAANPADGYSISVPNFLGIRKFCQLAASDSMRRFSAGDSEGAALAIAAGMRLTEKLPEHPTLVALMIRVATDTLLVPKTVRLPATDDGFASLAKDVAAKRAQFLRCIQIEGWALLRFAGQEGGEANVFHGPPKYYLPKWAVRVSAGRYWTRECVRAAFNCAQHAGIHKAPETLRLADFGTARHVAVSTQNPTVCEQGAARNAMRLHAVLLLREQTELIRLARARLAAGLPVESRDSIVLPSARWELTADAQKNTITTRLVHAPEWIVNNTVTGNGTDFWLLPLDGSAAWHFRTPARTASE